DVGHDAERENREARERSAREHVEQTQDPALLRLEQLGEPDRIDSRNRDVRADAENDQGSEQKEQPLLQVAVLAGLAELRDLRGHRKLLAFLSLFALGFRVRPGFGLLGFTLGFGLALVRLGLGLVLAR